MCIHAFQVFNANPVKIALRLEFFCAYHKRVQFADTTIVNTYA